MSSTQNAFSNFLDATKTQFLADLEKNDVEKWTVVMGNEAGDLDSIACSIAYSYLASNLSNQATIALIQTPRTDLYLRPENLYAFSLANLSSDQHELLCIDDIPSSVSPSALSSKFVLVDHNSLLSKYQGRGKVVGIIDHHADEKHHLDAEFRDIVNPTGSCASLVARHFQMSWNESVPREVATILLAAIHIDTSGLRPDDKAVQIDHDSAAFLTPLSIWGPDSLQGDVEPSLAKLSKELGKRKKDISHLSTRDLLRRDYKEFTFGGLKTGLATVPMGLKEWSKKDKEFWAGLHSYMSERSLAILGVLTTFKSDKGHKREDLFMVDPTAISTEAEERLFRGLEMSSDLDLERKEKFVDEGKDHARAWNQRNTAASRKLIAPLVGSLIEGGEAAGRPVDETS